MFQRLFAWLFPRPKADMWLRKPEALARSSKWQAIRNRWLAAHPKCEACGSILDLTVHHKHPFHLYPELEEDPYGDNLMTLCEGPGGGCHLTFGHLRFWPAWNPDVDRDVARYRQQVRMRPTVRL